MSKNDHLNYKRPEITRTQEVLAKDQREIINDQKKKNELLQKHKNMEMFGLINSKIYSYVELSSDICMKKCNKNIKNKDENTLLDTSVFNINIRTSGNNDNIMQNINMECLDNCLNKKVESFRMLLNVKVNTLIF